jgi:Flp pilus assembly pilin Flp
MVRFLRNEGGIAITEYGLLITLIAIVVIGVIVIFGGGIQTWFGSKTGAITTY